ncbi:unnamed protein product, partial [Iphiclides podalirius]
MHSCWRRADYERTKENREMKRGNGDVISRLLQLPAVFECEELMGPQRCLPYTSAFKGTVPDNEIRRCSGLLILVIEKCYEAFNFDDGTTSAPQND